MKLLKLLLGLFLTTTLLSSCVIAVEDTIIDDRISLEQLVTSHDIWYVDYNRTTGAGDIPFLSKAFTISFRNGRLYANNNLVGIGAVGNGYGLQIGYYETINGVLEIDHNQDGFIDLEVIQIAADEIKIRDTFNNVSYYLIGYYLNTFDYDQVFYDNIEYFLQEYVAWEKLTVSDQGEYNEFDNENFLEFTPQANESVFRSSQDQSGTNIANIIWDYVGNYEVFDVTGYDNLKILTLDYDAEGNEEFELSVINDGEVELYHPNSGTTYVFEGRGNIIYKKGEESKTVRNTKRFKVNRKTKSRNTTKKV